MDTSSSVDPVTEQPQTTPTVDPQHATDGNQQTWLVMLYFDADDAALEEDMYFDLNEAEMVGSTDRVKIVAQIDRSDQGFEGDGNWTSARRYFIIQDSDLKTIHSSLVADIGEVDMGSEKTLVDFSTWAIQSYPADRVVLIMSDHGAGWPGGWTDSKPEDSSGNFISLNELDHALDQTIKKTGISKLELIGLDACLMSTLEVYNSLAPYALYAVASEETEPSLGWAYADFLGSLTGNPNMNGEDLARGIVDSYVSQDQRFLNDEARKEMLSNYGYSKEMSAEDFAREQSTEITLSAIDLSALSNLNTALNNLLIALKTIDQQKVAEARSYAQAFANVFDDNFPSPYLDLMNLSNIIAQTAGDENVNQAVAKLKAELEQVLVAEKHGELYPGASGISIYFPVSDLYWGDTAAGFDNYTFVASRFAEKALWDDFLAFHYAGQDFGLGNPDEEARPPAPGASKISISKLTISTENLSQETPRINVHAEITGDKVGYIYYGILRFDKNLKNAVWNGLYFVHPDNSREQDGVFYPLWDREDGVIHIDAPAMISHFVICDGKTCVPAYFYPHHFAELDSVFCTDGQYEYAASHARVDVDMCFQLNRNNITMEMHNIIGYSGDEVKTPADIIPKPGDQFFPMIKEIVVSGNGAETKESSHTGVDGLTFGDQVFFMDFVDYQPGTYMVYLIASDLDGVVTTQQERFIVKK
ncbi:MAG: clostripain-related cysteine peptidase [Anaerolineaceae bacterium]